MSDFFRGGIMEADAGALVLWLFGAAMLAMALFWGDDDDDEEETPVDDTEPQGNDGTRTLENGDVVPAIQGSAGDNSIGGAELDMSGPQYINAGQGNDTVFAGGDDDVVLGASGDDSLNGSTGNDSLFGGEGDDTVIGGWGNDLVTLGIGADTTMSDDLVSALGLDADATPSLADFKATLDGLDQDLLNVEMGGDDQILGGVDSTSELAGQDGDDLLVDLIGSNNVIAGVGNDTVMAVDRDADGEVSPDVVFGGFGRDVIYVDNGDEVTLNPPEDTFQTTDHLMIANILSSTASTDGDGDTLDATDYVTVNDYDPENDMIWVLSDTLENSDLEVVDIDGSTYVQTTDGDVLVLLEGLTVAEAEAGRIRVTSELR